MFNLGDRVKHNKTGNIGIVVGYGNRIVNNRCWKTIKVKITSPGSERKKTIKDVDFKWLLCPEETRSTVDHFVRPLIVKPVKRYDLAKSA